MSVYVDTNGESGGDLMRRESQGTMQLLDRLGHGLVAEGRAENLGKPDRANAYEQVVYASEVPIRSRNKKTSTAAVKSLAFLSHIRSIIAIDNDGAVYGEGRGDDEASVKPGIRTALAVARRKDSPPDGAAIFNSVRVLLEQNTGDHSECNEEVALECLKVLREAMSWVTLTLEEGQSRPSVQHARPNQAPLQGPGHRTHAAQGWIASTLPSVIDCFSMVRLRDSAMDVLAECALGQKRLPDVATILVDELVRHGMEHDENGVRLWSTFTPSRLMDHGLNLGDREFSSVLEGLGGRALDADRAVMDSALEALGEMYQANPDTFRRSEARLGVMHRKIFHHYGERIYFRSRDPQNTDDQDNAGKSKGGPLHIYQHGADMRVIDSVHRPQQETSVSITKEQNQTSSPARRRRSSMSNSDVIRDRRGSREDPHAKNHVRTSLMSSERANTDPPPFDTFADGAVEVASKSTLHTKPPSVQHATKQEEEGGQEKDYVMSAKISENLRKRAALVRAEAARDGKDKGAYPNALHDSRVSTPRPVLQGSAATEETGELKDDRRSGSPISAFSTLPGHAGSAYNKGTRTNGACHGCSCGSSDDDNRDEPPRSSMEAPLIYGFTDEKSSSTSYHQVTEAPNVITSQVSREAKSTYRVRRGETPASTRTVSAAGAHPGDAGMKYTTKQGILPPSITPADLLRSLVRVESAGRGCRGLPAAAGMRFSGPSRLPKEASGSAGSRRQERIQAMEAAKRLTLDMDRDVTCSSGSHLEELLAVLLRLTEDSDVKIALLALQTLHILVVYLGKRLQPQTTLLLGALIAKLEDHRVATRHHAMAVLAALVCCLGLPIVGPYLIRQGLRSNAWRTREGSLKLMIAGLQAHSPLSPSPPIVERTARERVDSPGGTGDGLTRLRGSERYSLNESVLDEAQLVRDVGVLLTDKQSEVRFAAVETLAVAASSWRDKVPDIISILEDADLLRSIEARRHLFVRLQDYDSKLSSSYPEEIVDLGSGSTLTAGTSAPDPLTASPWVAHARDMRRGVNDHSNDAPGLVDKGAHSGSKVGGQAEESREKLRSEHDVGCDKRDISDERALRCWRSDGSGELQEVAPWECRVRGQARESAAGDLVGVCCAGCGSSFEALDHGCVERGVRGYPSVRPRARMTRDGFMGSPDKSCPLGDSALQGRSTDFGVAHGYTPSWAKKSESGTTFEHQSRERGYSTDRDDSDRAGAQTISLNEARALRRVKNEPASPKHLPSKDVSEHSRWTKGSTEDEEHEVSSRGHSGTGGRGSAGRRGDSCESPTNLELSLLSALKRGGSRNMNARASRRAASAAAASGGGDVSSGISGGVAGGDPIPPVAYGGGRSIPRDAVPAEPTTPVPVGRYDSTGRRRHMETTVQQPLPLAHPGAGGRETRRVSWGRRDERSAAPIDSDGNEDRCRMRATDEASRSKHSSLKLETNRSSTPRPHRKHRQDGEISDEPSSAEPPRQEYGEVSDHRSSPLRDAAEASRRRRASRGGKNCDRVDSRQRGSSGVGEEAGAGAGRKEESTSSLRREAAGAAAASPPSARSGFKPDSFDYLAAEDIRPSPNPTQELQRAMSSLPQDDWPEIFHTLNSVRRLAAHHAPLLSSQPHLHALVRDVLALVENLRSQVAKNSLLALADLWRGLRDTLDPELPMVCPVLVKKMADKVEFLADAARQCVDEVVANANEARALSAFQASENHRSPVVRAKSALSILLCVRRRCAAGGKRGFGVREMDRLLTTVPRFLQDRSQETRLHARSIVALLLDTGEVDEARLRRELPPPILERLQRDLLNSSLPSGLGFTPPFVTPASTGRSSSTRRPGQGSTLPDRCGYPRSSDSASSPKSFSSSAGAGGNRGRAGSSCAGQGSGGNLGVGGGDKRTEDGPQEERNRLGGLGGNISAPSSQTRRPTSTKMWEDEGLDVYSAMDQDSSPSRCGQAESSRSSGGGRGPQRPQGLSDSRNGNRYGDVRRRQQPTVSREATALLERHGNDINATAKTRLLDRIADLLSDGNLKVNLLALESVARLASSSGAKLDPAVNTLVPAVCKNLASSSQQRVVLAEEAIVALCKAIDPCLMAQPVASLAQYGNVRLKVPMLALLRNLVPAVGDTKPTLLTKYVRPAALALVRDNRPNVRDAALFLLRAVEVALDPIYPRGGEITAHSRRVGDTDNGRRQRRNLTTSNEGVDLLGGTLRRII